MNTKAESRVHDFNLERPNDYHLVRNTPIQIDETAGTLLRYEHKDGTNNGLLGEHFSIVHDNANKLKGFVNMSLSLAKGSLPTKEDAETIARDFLKQHAPDLVTNLELHWIKEHDETICINQQTVTLTGMKVKMRNPNDGKWFWVIVGSNRKAMIFERDIVWISFPGHRQTEKWLHDEWLIAQNKTAEIQQAC